MQEEKNPLNKEKKELVKDIINDEEKDWLSDESKKKASCRIDDEECEACC